MEAESSGGARARRRGWGQIQWWGGRIRQAAAAVVGAEAATGSSGWAWWAHDGLDRLFIYFFVFYFIYRDGQQIASEKANINRNLSSEAVAKTALVKSFYLPR